MVRQPKMKKHYKRKRKVVAWKNYMELSTTFKFAAIL